MIEIKKSETEGYFNFDGRDYPKGQYTLIYDPDSRITLKNIHTDSNLFAGRELTEFQGVTTIEDLLLLLKNIGAFATNDVQIENKSTQAIILPMAQEVADSELSIEAVEDQYTINVLNVTNMAVGQHIRIINSDLSKFYTGVITAINGLIISLDSPLDFNYTVGSKVYTSIVNMNVDGSTTVQIFKHRLATPSTKRTTDITRLIIACTTATAIDLKGFGDLTKLAKGILFRKVNNSKSNIFNIKSNEELANISYDFNIYVATNPSQGIDGFVCRLTFAGQNKIGTAIRIDPSENLEVLIQDDLTGLTSLQVIAEGHVIN